jgi:hypothetical protein
MNRFRDQDGQMFQTLTFQPAMQDGAQWPSRRTGRAATEPAAGFVAGLEPDTAVYRQRSPGTITLVSPVAECAAAGDRDATRSDRGRGQHSAGPHGSRPMGERGDFRLVSGGVSVD